MWSKEANADLIWYSENQSYTFNNFNKICYKNMRCHLVFQHDYSIKQLKECILNVKVGKSVTTCVISTHLDLQTITT